MRHQPAYDDTFSDLDMPDENEDTPYFRIPSSSSSFFALATLKMPSPSPSISSSFSFSMDFNDLPFMVVSAVEGSSTEGSPASKQEEWLNKPLATESLNSLDSVCSVGTFGQARQRQRSPPLSRGSSYTESLIAPPRPEDEEDVVLSAFRVADNFDLDDVDSPFPSPMELLGRDFDAYVASANPLGSVMRASASHNVIDDSRTLDTGPSLSAIYSRQRQREATLLGHYTGGRLQASESLQNHPYSGHGSAARREETPRYRATHTPPARPARNVAPSAVDIVKERRVAAGAIAEKVEMKSSRAITVLRKARPSPLRPKKDQSPGAGPTRGPEFVWLHGISIDLLIDQEGFRTATPSFRYSGVNRSKHDATTCTVTFRATPLKSPCYFHYNPFDSLPILRRVTIHGEESKDYISKQAQLTLKTNGVYSVHGAEISSLAPLHHPARILSYSPLIGNGQAHEAAEKLDWVFQYLVKDRLDAHGLAVDGEKEFVPLTFTCSPWLLHPSQGKRVNLIQMFRKGVAMKLTAEKTPTSRSNREGRRKTQGSGGVPQMVVSVTTPDSSMEMGDGYGAGGLGAGAKPVMHRRAMSHAVWDRDEHLEVKKAPAVSGYGGRYDRGFLGPGGSHGDGTRVKAMPGKYQLEPVVRRRASSVDEGSWLSM